MVCSSPLSSFGVYITLARARKDFATQFTMVKSFKIRDAGRTSLLRKRSSSLAEMTSPSFHYRTIAMPRHSAVLICSHAAVSVEPS